MDGGDELSAQRCVCDLFRKLITPTNEPDPFGSRARAGVPLALGVNNLLGMVPPAAWQSHF